MTLQGELDHVESAPWRWRHTLIVGGTGMLADAARHLVRKSLHSTMIARTGQSLDAFARSLDTPTCLRVDCRAVDYRQLDDFDRAVYAAIEEHGVPELVLVWCHQRRSVLALAEQLAAYGRPLTFFHVNGIAGADAPRT